MECPAESTLIDLVARSVATGPASVIEAHLADCADCRRLAFALAAERAADPSDVPRHRIGRFDVLAEIGAGAMGRVYRARDPELERQVAIKVRRATSALTRDGDERLRREGQALARLSHPNVIAVHETGVDAGASYIIMEYVEGVTLDRWVADPRPVRTVIGALAGVARGLAAAHGAGLVHRDVKPSNILVTADGTAKIGDFGLARLDVDRAGAGAGAPLGGELTVTLSMTGSLVGTPAYMAPEQLQGGVASERSDQFAFCVTLFEAITGARPFAGGTTAELFAAIARGPSAAALERVPARVRGVLSRGLALDPARRFPSMIALAEALLPRATRAGWLAVAGAIGLAVAGVLLARSADPLDGCAVPDGRLAAMFGAPRRVLITARFAARDPRGADEARVVGDLLVAYGQRWQSAETTSCRASSGQPSRLRDRQRACLERRLARADDLAALLTQPAADAPVIEAARGVEALGDPAACLRVAAEGTELDPPRAGFTPLIAAFERQVDRVVNLVESRRPVEVRDVQGLVAAVRTLGAPALLARALIAQADVHAQREQFGELEVLLDEAAREAARARDDRMVAEAWTARVFTMYGRLGHTADARRWLAVADAALLRAGDPPELRARLHQVAGGLYARAGEYARARREMAAALALLEQIRPPAVLSLAAAHNNFGLVLMQAGATAEARSEIEHALTRVRDVHGELHPDVIRALLNLGLVLGSSDARKAIEYLSQARAIATQVAGPASFEVAKSLDLEGLARQHLGEYATAVALHRRAYEIKRADITTSHPSLGYSLGNLARAEISLGDRAAAARDARASVRILAEALGPRDTHLAHAHSILGDALVLDGDARGAITAYRSALAILDTSDDLGGEQGAVVRVDLARVLAVTGAPAEACALFTRADAMLRGVRGGSRNYPLVAQAGLVACDADGRRVDRVRLRALEDAVAAERALSPEAIGFIASARARAWAALGDLAQARALATAARAAFARAGILDRIDVPVRALAAIR